MNARGVRATEDDGEDDEGEEDMDDMEAMRLQMQQDGDDDIGEDDEVYELDEEQYQQLLMQMEAN